MELSEALVELYKAVIKNGVLILDQTAEPDQYTTPVSKSVELFDWYKKAPSMWTNRHGKYSLFNRIRFIFINKQKKLRRKLKKI